MAAEELAADWAGPESWPDSGVENQFGIDGSGDGGMFGVLAPQSSAGSEGEFVMLHLTCNIPPPGQPRTGTVRCALGKTVGDLRAMIASTLEIESAFDIEGSSDITSVSTTVYLRDLDLADQTALDITNARPIAPEHSPPSTPRGDVSEEDPPSPRINRSAVAGQTVSTGITTTSYGTSYGSSWNSKSNTGFVGLSNQGATCYLNSLIQGLYMTFELRKAIYQWEYDPTKYEAVDECVPAQLQRLFVALQTSDERAVETEGLTKAFGWTDSDAFEQQDVNEMLVLLFDALEVKFKGTPQAGLIRALYQGEYQDYVQCRECGHKAGAGRQPFQASDINIAIREFGCTTPISSIEEGLAKYFKSELLDGDNQYECEKCAKKVDADKGLQLTKVPYVLCLGMKRFEYDWERDARCKVDDRVTFPRTLDMAQFLAPDEGDAGAEAVPPDDAGETTSPRSADAAAQEEALRRSVSFGKNNTPLEAANAQTVIEHGGSLPYELFAVLIHSGSAIGGHYYSYLKSGGPDGTWYEFNDSSISAIDDDDLEKAFGGASTMRGGRGSYSYSFTSSASAYMLMYRRMDLRLNINELSRKDLPPKLSAEMEAERQKAAVERDQQQKERERKQNEYEVAVYASSGAIEFSVQKDSSLLELKQAIHSRLGLDAALPLDCMRLKKWSTYYSIEEPMTPSEDDTPLYDIKLDWNAAILLETKLPEEQWGAAFATFGSGISLSNYDNELVIKLFHYDTSITEVSEPQTVLLQVGSTYGDLKEAAHTLFGVEKDFALFTKVEYYTLSQISGDDATPLRNTRPGIYRSGEEIVVRDNRYDTGVGGAVTHAALKRVLDQRTKHATVYFTDVGGAEYVHVLRCESKIEHPSLAAQISEVVGRPADEIKMIDGGNSRELYGELDLIARLRVVATEKGGKKHMVPIFTFVGDRDNGGPYLFDMPVHEDITVLELKERIAAKMGEEGTEGCEDARGTHMRLRELGYSVFLDDQTVIEAVRNFAGTEKFAVSLLDRPEQKKRSLQAVVSFFRWYPSEFRVDDKPVEIVCDDRWPYAEVRAAVAERIGGGFAPADVGMAKKSYSMESTLDVPDLDWDPDQPGEVGDMSRPRTDKWGYKIVPPTDIGYLNDGDVFFFRDNRDALKELDEEEKKKIRGASKVKASASKGRFTAREEGVKLNLAKGPAQPEGAPVILSPASEEDGEAI